MLIQCHVLCTTFSVVLCGEVRLDILKAELIMHISPVLDTQLQTACRLHFFRQEYYHYQWVGALMTMQIFISLHVSACVLDCYCPCPNVHANSYLS